MSNTQDNMTDPTNTNMPDINIAPQTRTLKDAYTELNVWLALPEQEKTRQI